MTPNLKDTNKSAIQKIDKLHLINKKSSNNIENTFKQHKGRKEGYDNFAIIQDVLEHEAKAEPTQSSKMSGLLSVTTL